VKSIVLPAEPSVPRSKWFTGQVASPGLPAVHGIGVSIGVSTGIPDAAAAFSRVTHSTIDDTSCADSAGPSCAPLTASRLDGGESRLITGGMNIMTVSRTCRSLSPTRYGGGVGVADAIDPS